MKKNIDAFLVLGCGGYETSSGFIICSAISNPILDLAIISSDYYENLEKFLDQACGLFDKPIYDYNKLVNVITMLYRKNEVIDETRLVEIQRFIKLHKDCGLFLTLLTKEDFNARK